jgi:hypothetical protein
MPKLTLLLCTFELDDVDESRVSYFFKLVVPVLELFFSS